MLIVNILEINILNLGSQHMTLTLPSWRTANRARCVETEPPHAHGGQPKTNAGARKHARCVLSPPPAQMGIPLGGLGGRDGHHRKTGNEYREFIQARVFCYLDEPATGSEMGARGVGCLMGPVSVCETASLGRAQPLLAAVSQHILHFQLACMGGAPANRRSPPTCT